MTATAAVERLDLEALRGDRTAFDAWYERTAPRVYAYVLTRCGRDTHLAEEITQQAFVAALRDGRAHPIGDAFGWLCGIARHKLVDHYRRLEREERLGVRMVREITPIDELAAWRVPEERETIERALRILTPVQRLAFLYRYLDRLSIREVGALIGKSEKATESLIGRARERFEQAYEEAIDAD
jgi:RNA polymerase sigma-70 factor (ECF subfamily)